MDFLAWPELKSIIGILFLTFFLGLCDDLVHVKPYVKLLGQTIAGSLVFFLLDIKLDSSYGILGDFKIPALPSYFLTVFVIIIITNSFNLIDGIDGLAGAFSITCLIFYGIWFYLTGDSQFALLCFSLSGAVIAFLIFNWEPSKIFMGDTGALLIGMMLSILTIHFIQANVILPSESPFKFQSTISTALAVIILPVVDTLRIIIIRLYNGVSPLSADKRHIHHCMIRLGLSHQQSVLILVGLHLLFITLVILFKDASDKLLLAFVSALSVSLCLMLNRFMLKKIS